jgi:hypothetical protein
MEVPAENSSNTVAVPATTTTKQPSSFFCGIETIKIVVEIISLACVVFWFHRKTTAMNKQIAELTARLEETETAIERHENVLKKVMTLLGGGKSQRQAQVPLTPRPSDISNESVESQPEIAIDPIGMMLQSFLQHQNVPVQPQQAPVKLVDQPSIVEISEKDLDKELSNEIEELHK